MADWSAGQPVEDSIYKAHINLINTSQHYICIQHIYGREREQGEEVRKYVRYNVDFVDIQNQYFISSTNAGRPKNKIALAIARRLHHLLALYSHCHSHYNILFSSISSLPFCSSVSSLFLSFLLSSYQSSILCFF